MEIEGPITDPDAELTAPTSNDVGEQTASEVTSTQEAESEPQEAEAEKEAEHKRRKA